MVFPQILYMHLYWRDLEWNFTRRFVTELWPLIDVLQHEMHYSGAIVRFSELDIAEACWLILFKFLCVSSKGWRTAEQYFGADLSIENGSSKLTHSFLSHLFKSNIHSPGVDNRPV